MYEQPVDYENFPTLLRKELDKTIQGDWVTATVRFDCVNNFSEVKLFPYDINGKRLEVQRNDNFAQLMFDLRSFSYKTSGSAWYTTEIKLDKTNNEIHQSYNYEDEPKWEIPAFTEEQKEYVLNREYASELDNFPREKVPTPSWLINRAINWNPSQPNPFNEPLATMPQFDEPPQHVGHNHPKADAVISTLVSMCLTIQPVKEIYGEWSKIIIQAHAVGDLFEWHIEGENVYGEKIPVTSFQIAEDLEQALQLLRLATYSKKDGAWFNMELELISDTQSVNIHFDYDKEPEWNFPRDENGNLNPQTYVAYRSELENFPRTEDRIPTWLRDRL